jgi:ATP-dependent Clp protease ATP-binding subunit ClpC
MNPVALNLHSPRARKARLAASMKKGGLWAAALVAITCGLGAAYLFFVGQGRWGYLLSAPGLVALMYVAWYKAELMKLPSRLPAAAIDDTLESELLARLKQPLTPRSLWQALTGNWQEIFITNRLVLDPKFVEDSLSDTEADLPAVWQLALKLQSATDPNVLYAGTITTALILCSPVLTDHLTKRNIRPEDTIQCYDWLARLIKSQNMAKPYFGGVGRDWAFGFTPNLERFSVNITKQVESGRGHFHFMSRSSMIDTLLNNLDQATGGVAIVGETGIGKSSVVYALAERLLDDKTTATLRHHQIVMLNASVILSSAKETLEQTMLMLFGEAVQAGNMILFLDEAQLFFQEGTGAFDLSRILQPVLQNRRLKLITAFHPTDYQRLKSSNPSLMSMLTPVMLQEPSAEDTLKIVEDSALGVEHQTKTIITYDAVREAIRLSGQYMQQLAYPGKAIQLVEQSTSYAVSRVVTAASIQQTVEQTLGVKAGGAQGQEADVLLNLEDRIHERMINQSQAVNVVAAALRRSRAGVGSTKRPIGSFLFMGPTGVGKTELARSLAATYFGDESNMVRLDMSEYQQASDVSRLLDDGSDSNSLILSIRKQPFSVVLLDEIEKAHANILNILLQMLDEGQITDTHGQHASFRNAIIIVTSNAGSKEIIARLNANQTLTDFERPLVNQLIEQGVFRAELINRFDDVVLFRPLNQQELGQVAALMLKEVNRTLANQNISVEVTPAALESLVRQGYDPQFGSRPMRRVIQRTVEDVVARKILAGQATPGTKILLDLPDIAGDPNVPQQPSQTV